MFCKKCGKELEDGTAFCQFCGQNQAEDVAEKAEKKEAQISNKQLFLAGAVMAAVILAVIAGFRLIGGEKETNLAENAVEEEAVKTETDLEEAAKEKPVEEAHETIAPQTEGETDETVEAAEAEKEEKHQISHIVAGENEYWFDEDGDLVRAKEGAQTLEIQYLTDAEGKKVEISERMRDILENIGVSVHDIYGILYNTKGYLLTSWNWDYGDGSTTKETCTYDGENIVKMQMTETGNGGGWSEDTSFRYDEGTDQITISQHTIDLREGMNSEYWNEYSCIFEGDKLTEYLIDNSDGFDVHRVKEYDAGGNLVRDKFDYNTGDDHTEVTIYQYDGSGNLLVCEKAEKSEYKGEERENTVTTDKYQYDEKGNRIKQESEMQKTREGKKYENHTIIEYQFDEKGNRIKEESETQGTREGKKYEDHTTIEYQFDEKGNEIQEKANGGCNNYNEAGIAVEQSVWERNNIWEYDAEDRLTYHSDLRTSTGSDIYKYESAYLYDEQGRLTEILTDGETAMLLSYMDEEMVGQADLLKKIENVKGIDSQARFESNVVKELIPNGEMEEIHFFSNDADINSIFCENDIVIEYR